jgi:DNA-binding SARP family transcriptional activator
VRIGVLGPLTVYQGKLPVEVVAAKQRCLLALLSLQPNRVVRREEIVDVLWGDSPPLSCLELVHTYISRLRKAIEPGRRRREPAQTITAVAGGYLLSVGKDQLDLLQFDGWVADAERALASADFADAEQCFLSALRLWRGPVLGDLPDRFRQNPACLALSRRRSAAVLSYANVALSLGRFEEVASQLRGLTADDPLHEAAHARLMLALAGSGQQAAALGLFADIRRRLADELGIEPGPELRQAQLQVLQQNFRALTPTNTVPTPTTVRPAQLPAEVTGFTGRAEHLAELNRIVPGDGENVGTVMSIAAVSGTAGVGKTAVAVHWAHRMSDRFPDGRLYVDLGGYGPERPVDPRDVLSGFLRALGVDSSEIPAELGERAARYRTVLHRLRVLLVLDNASSVEQVRPLLPGSPSCFVIVTSRDSLPGLIARHGARRIHLDRLHAAEAFSLLRTLLGDRVDSEPDATDALVECCVRLPLALRLAAELVTSRPGATLAALAADMADEHRRLNLLNSGGDPRTAVRAVFSWSYRHR